MASSDLSIEEQILRAVKITLVGVIKDTATPPGMRHPLSDQTIEDMRQCLALVSARERALAEAAGRPIGGRPGFIDEPVAHDRVIHFHPRKPAGDQSE